MFFPLMEKRSYKGFSYENALQRGRAKRLIGDRINP